MGSAISKCLNREKRSAVFIGPKDSGKRDIIKILRKDKTEEAINMYEQFTVRGKGYSTEIYAISEDQNHINFWKFYTQNCNLVVFVVNISEEKQIEESKNVFENFFTSYGTNKESIAFMLCRKREGETEEKSALEDQRNSLKFKEHFSTIAGLDKKLLEHNIIVNETTSRSKLLSFICNNYS
ncbi:GTP-binding protein SAR1 [Nematocida ausubeli]|nr:GTP-binding protein SAR1 [Nematocida ausubeli]